MGTNLQRNRQVYSQPLFGRGSGGGASHREAASPGVSLRSLYAACPRRLCQPPWTHTTGKESRPSRMGANLQRNRQVYSQPLFGRGSGGGRFSMRSASPGVSLRSLYAACPRRLCQPPWTHTTSKESHPPCMGTNLQRNRQVYSQPLFGRGSGGGRFSMRSASPGVSLRSLYAACPRRLCQPPWTHTTSKESRPSRMGANLQRNRQAYFQPLFGRGSGGGASLREAASPGNFPLYKHPVKCYTMRR